MGFVFKSVFWLGIVYSLMPLGQLSSTSASGIGELVCNPVTRGGEYRLDLAEGCAAIIASRLMDPAPVEPMRGLPSADAGAPGSLTDVDRQPPWIGEERRTSAEPRKPRWRTAHRVGYKRIASTHPEGQTVDD